VNIGIVGCGLIADHHIPHILRDKRVTTLSIADLDERKAAETARRYALKRVYTDFESMHSAQGLDAVHILTPPQTHAPLAIEAMDAGCHTLVEKPMALTLSDADAMIQSAQRNKVQLYVDHNYLFSPVVMEAQRLVQSGDAGRILHVETHYNFDIQRLPNLGDNPAAHWTFHLPAGLISDHLAHPASLLLSFIDTPDTIHTVQKRNGVLPGNCIDELRVLVDSDDATGLLSVSLGTRPDCFTLTIYGTEMTIHGNLTNMTLVKRRNRNLPKAAVRVVDNIEQAMQLLGNTITNTYKIALGKMRPPGDIGPAIAAFYTSIEMARDPFDHAEAGKKVVALMDQIYSHSLA
jgi:predicted dehydrogenase